MDKYSNLDFLLDRLNDYICDHERILQRQFRLISQDLLNDGRTSLTLTYPSA
jgi:hypothetical protein